MKRIILSLLLSLVTCIVYSQGISITQIGDAIMENPSYADARQLLISNGFVVNKSIEQDLNFGEHFITTSTSPEDIVLVFLQKKWDNKKLVDLVRFEFYGICKAFSRLGKDMLDYKYYKTSFRPGLAEPDEAHKNGKKAMLLYMGPDGDLQVEFIIDENNYYK